MTLLIRWVCLALVRLFYRKLRIVHAEKLPSAGPVIVVANHPNGLIDPMIVNRAVGRRVAFLGKSTLFRPWLGKKAMAAFDGIPVFRAKEADTARNDATFAICRAHLQRGGWLALFPEGTSHSAPQLLPLKTGAARIALQSELPGLVIVPIGLTYEAKDLFRSGVSATVGEAIPIAPFIGQSDARALTEAIARALRDVVLEADDATLWRGFRFVARWLEPGAADPDERARALGRAYRTLLEQAPVEAAAIVEDVRAFARLLEAVGVEEPFELEARPRLRSVAVTLLGVALALPPALAGALLAYLPYRLVGVVARRVAGDDLDLVSTIKALAGLLFFPLAFGAWALLAGLQLGAAAGAAVLVLGPACGYIALRFGEWLARRRQLLGALWKRVDLALVAEARAQLAARLDRALTGI